MVLIFDLDDTLIDTSDLFWKVREEYLSLIANSNAPVDATRTVFEIQDTQNMRQLGFQPERYGKTMLDVYQNLINEKKIQPSIEMEKKIFDIGQKIVNEVPELITGSIEILKKLKKDNHDLLLVTRGASKTQSEKIEYHSLQKYFNEIFVVDFKNADVFKNIIETTGYNVHDCWIIGDSIKSDINPGLTLGANCIHYKYKHDHYNWIQEHDASPISLNYFEVSDIRMVREIINTHQFNICFEHSSIPEFKLKSKKLQLR